MVKHKFERYEYPLKDANGNEYNGSYTIKEGVKPLKLKDEKLVQKFETEVKA